MKTKNKKRRSRKVTEWETERTWAPFGMKTHGTNEIISNENWKLKAVTWIERSSRVRNGS